MSSPPSKLYLLLDTCILVNLVSQHSYSVLLKKLKKLKKLIEKEYIIIFTPTTLLDEWERQKVEKQTRVLKEIGAENEKRKLISNPMAGYTEAQIKRIKEILVTQFTDIDDLLQNKSIKIEKDGKLDTLIVTQIKEKRAPFLEGRNSILDAEIFYSTLSYCKVNGLDKFYFVSSNSRDYAISKSRPTELHSDYLAVYPEIQIEFFHDIRNAFALFESMGVLEEEKISEELDANIRMDQPFVDKSAPILDQVVSYMSQLFDHLKIIPRSFFEQHYPFRITPDQQFWPEPFTLDTDNEALYTLLQVSVTSDEITDTAGNLIIGEEDKHKIHFVFSTLQRNWITSVSLNRGKKIEIRYKGKNRHCVCSLCHYRRLELDLAAETLYSDQRGSSTNEIDELARGYLKYSLGDFRGCLDNFLSVFENTETRALQKYIAAFNLKLIVKLLEYEYNNEAIVQRKVRTIEAINLSEARDEAITQAPLYGPIINWIHDRKFYTDAKEVLNNSAGEMRDFYYSRNGGSVEFTLKALETYLLTDDFLNGNFIVYNKFSEFSALTNSFTEVLFSSYNCSRHLGGRLIAFSDNVLYRLILHADSQIVKKYSDRYEVINAKKNVSEEDGFFHFSKASEHFFRNYQKMNGSGHFTPGFYGDDKLMSTGVNILHLWSILDLPLSDFATFSDCLFDFLSNPNPPDYRVLQALTRLFIRKGDFVPDEFFVKLLPLIIRNGHFHDEPFFTAVTNRLLRKAIKIDEALFKDVIEKFLIKCPTCNRKHPFTFLSNLLPVFSVSQISHIHIILTENLFQKFVADEYYLATMIDLIIPVPALEENYFEFIREAIRRPYPRPSFFSAPEYSDYRVDQFFNYALKFRIDIPDDIVAGMRGVSSYYNWLLNPDEFDYANFDIEWLTIHFTLHYKKWFRESERLRTFFLEYFHKDSNKLLEKKYIQIYAMGSTSN